MFLGSSVGGSVGGGATFTVEFFLSDSEGNGGGALDAPSLSHSSEQLVFQKPILSCSRSYVTSVLRTTIPVVKKII